jgi:hypothetical protein
MSLYTKDGKNAKVRGDQYAELLAADPFIASMPAETQIVLTSCRVGDDTTDDNVASVLARRLGRPVWAATTTVSWRHNDQGNYQMAVLTERGVPGKWIRFDPSGTKHGETGSRPAAPQQPGTTWELRQEPQIHRWSKRKRDKWEERMRIEAEREDEERDLATELLRLARLRPYLSSLSPARQESMQAVLDLYGRPRASGSNRP